MGGPLQACLRDEAVLMQVPDVLSESHLVCQSGERMQCSMFVPASNLGTTLDESVPTVDVDLYLCVLRGILMVASQCIQGKYFQHAWCL